jgi:hypothetical protein
MMAIRILVGREKLMKLVLLRQRNITSIGMRMKTNMGMRMKTCMGMRMKIVMKVKRIM